MCNLYDILYYYDDEGRAYQEKIRVVIFSLQGANTDQG